MTAMYQSYFGLTDAPFSIAPNPRYLFMSQRHQEALAHLLYGVNGDGGFVLLTGEVGTGKTTVCRCLLEQVPEASEAVVREALSGNLCRCTGYEKILEAVRLASDRMRIREDEL